MIWKVTKSITRKCIGRIHWWKRTVKLAIEWTNLLPELRPARRNGCRCAYYYSLTRSPLYCIFSSDEFPVSTKGSLRASAPNTHTIAIIVLKLLSIIESVESLIVLRIPLVAPAVYTTVSIMIACVPSAKYSPVCNVLRLWKTALIPPYL